MELFLYNLDILVSPYEILHQLTNRCCYSFQTESRQCCFHGVENLKIHEVLILNLRSEELANCLYKIGGRWVWWLGGRLLIWGFNLNQLCLEFKSKHNCNFKCWSCGLCFPGSLRLMHATVFGFSMGHSKLEVTTISQKFHISVSCCLIVAPHAVWGLWWLGTLISLLDPSSLCMDSDNH